MAPQEEGFSLARESLLDGGASGAADQLTGPERERRRRKIAALGDRHVTDAAALVVDNHTGDVLAYVGSPDYFSDEALGRNDGVVAGSVLSVA